MVCSCCLCEFCCPDSYLGSRFNPPGATHFHTATQATPYEVVYYQKPPIHLPYLPGESPNAVVDMSMQKREEILKILRGNLERAQHRMKMQAEKRRFERQFVLGDWVWLKLQHYR